MKRSILALVLTGLLTAASAAAQTVVSTRDADWCSMKALRWLQATEARDSGVTYSRHASRLTDPFYHNLYDAEAEAMRVLWETGEDGDRVHGRIFRECIAERGFTLKGE